MSRESEESSNVDHYGFRIPKPEYDEMMKEYLSVLVRRRIRWEKSAPSPGSKKLKRFVRKGVPSEMRAKVWMSVFSHKSKASYADYLSMKISSNITAEQINTDIPRTFPGNVNFVKNASNGYQQPLFNVLLAFANYNPEIGYCQGLNYIVGLLLLVTKDEEMSFHLLRALSEDILPDYFILDIPGLITDVRVFAQLIKRKVPRVYEKVEEMKMPWELIASKWFMCLFSDVLPTETVVRLWDSLFLEGSKILFRAAIALVKGNEEELLSCEDFTSLAKKFQEITTNSRSLNCHYFMQSMFMLSNPLSKKDIQTLRQSIRKDVDKELQVREDRKNKRRENA